MNITELEGIKSRTIFQRLRVNIIVTSRLALKKKYGNKVIIHDPSEVAVIMITSEEDNTSAEDMVKEFIIETVDHYFDRTCSDRNKQLKTKLYFN